MTLQIAKSTLVPPGMDAEDAINRFNRLLELYIQELAAWHLHDMKVKAEQDLDDPVRPQWSDYQQSADPAADYSRDLTAYEQTLLSRHHPYPKPETSPLIMAAVGSKISADGVIVYHPDYEIIDDEPQPEPTPVAQVVAATEEMKAAESPTLDQRKASLTIQLHQMEAIAVGKIVPSQARLKLNQIKVQEIRQKHDAVWQAVLSERIAEMQADPKSNQTLVITDEERMALLSDDDRKFLDEQMEINKAVQAILRKSAEAAVEIEELTVDNIDDYQLPTL